MDMLREAIPPDEKIYGEQGWNWIPFYKSLPIFMKNGIQENRKTRWYSQFAYDLGFSTRNDHENPIYVNINDQEASAYSSLNSFS